MITDEEKKEALKYYAVGWDLRKITSRILANRTSIVYYRVLEEIAWSIADYFEKENDRIYKDRKRAEVKM